MQRTLSVRATAFLKFVLPPIWIAVIGYIVWRLWTDPSSLLDRDVRADGTIVTWILLGLIGASLIVLFAFVLPLKRVRVVETGLQISNYLREITVPFDAILTVQQNWLPTFRLITLKLRPGGGSWSRVIFCLRAPSVSRSGAGTIGVRTLWLASCDASQDYQLSSPDSLSNPTL